VRDSHSDIAAIFPREESVHSCASKIASRSRVGTREPCQRPGVDTNLIGDLGLHLTIGFRKASARAPERKEGAMTAQHNPSAKPRRLKVGYFYPDSRASRSNAQSLPMPFLRLCGRWLDDAGFTIGRNVRVEVNEGRLMIEPVD